MVFTRIGHITIGWLTESNLCRTDHAMDFAKRQFQQIIAKWVGPEKSTPLQTKNRPLHALKACCGGDVLCIAKS